MKNIILALLFVCSNSLLFAQHSISVTGGCTFSTLYKTGSKAALNSYSYKPTYPFFYAGNIGAKYEYRHQSFNLSTGLSLLSLGSNDFWGLDIAYMYLTVPVLFGYKKNFSKDWSLVIEGGGEVGGSVSRVGSVEVLGRRGQTRYYLGLLLGVEGKYKRFSFGARFHLGLNDFEDHTFSRSQETVYFKHIGSTIYLGYTIWDSSRIKKKKKSKNTLKTEGK